MKLLIKSPNFIDDNHCATCCIDHVSGALLAIDSKYKIKKNKIDHLVLQIENLHINNYLEYAVLSSWYSIDQYPIE